MTDQLCGEQDCGMPTAGASLCEEHRAELYRLVEGLPGWVTDLRLAADGQRGSTGSTGAGGRADVRPLPFNQRAASELRRLAETLEQWAGRLADQVGWPARYPSPVAAAGYMIAVLHLGNTVDRFIDAGKMLKALREAVERCEGVLDRPDRKWYAGRCEAPVSEYVDRDGIKRATCQRELYAADDKAVIVCPLCGTRHDVKDRRETLLLHAENRLATASEAARAIVVLSDTQRGRGENKLAARIRQWRVRGRIEVKGTTNVHGEDAPLYRIGDILELVREHERRVAEKLTKASA